VTSDEGVQAAAARVQLDDGTLDVPINTAEIPVYD